MSVIPRGRRRAPFVWLVLTAIVVLVTYLGIAWALHKGFDLTDESWAYSLIASNRDTVGEAWGFQFLLHPIFLATGQSVLVFRVLRLLGYILLGIAIVAMARVVVNRLGYVLPRYQWWFILAVTQAGAFFAFAYPAPSLGYNELTSWFTQIGLMIMVVLLAQRFSGAGPVTRDRWLWLSWIALGVLLPLVMVSKITSGGLFALAGLVVLLVPGTGLPLWKRIVAVVAGLVGVLFVLLLCRYPVGDYVSNLLSLVFDPKAQAASGHPITSLLNTYRLSLSTGFVSVVPSTILFTASVSLCSVRVLRGARGVTTPPLVSRLAVLTAVLTVLSLFTLPVSGQYAQFTLLGLLAVFTGIGVIVVFLVLHYPAAETENQRRTNNVTIILMATAVIATPFITAFGTNNPITGEFLWSMTLWAAIFALGLMILANRLIGQKSMLWTVPVAIMFSFVLIVSFAVGKDILVSPYRNLSYAQQHTETDAPFLQGIHLTSAQAEWSDWLAAQSKDLGAKQVPTISLLSPGALLLFNNSPFASPWITLSGGAASVASVQTACEAQHPTDLIVLQPGIAPDTLAGRALHTCGFDFPRDFTMVADHPSGDPNYSMKIWRLSK